MQALEVAQSIPAAGGAALHQSLPPDAVSAAAVRDLYEATITVKPL
jgi:hypothetical protein